MCDLDGLCGDLLEDLGVLLPVRRLHQVQQALGVVAQDLGLARPVVEE